MSKTLQETGLALGSFRGAGVPSLAAVTQEGPSVGAPRRRGARRPLLPRDRAPSLPQVRGRASAPTTPHRAGCFWKPPVLVTLIQSVTPVGGWGHAGRGGGQAALPAALPGPSLRQDAAAPLPPQRQPAGPGLLLARSSLGLAMTILGPLGVWQQCFIPSP